MSSIGVDPLQATDSSITSQRPSAHTQRYDRQLRLWASSGQSSLEKSRLLVVGASALSAQILKNLVLPGIGCFVLLDDAIVNGADLGVNFFLQPGESEGKYAAEEMCRLLTEMNTSVASEAKLANPASLLHSDPSFFAGFTLVISVNQSISFDLALSDALWSLQPPSPQVPLLRVRTAGMLAEMQISLEELGIIETHPDSVVDLRITRPFPELLDLAQQFDLNTSDTMEHSHIPFPVILIKKLVEWQTANEGKLPTSANRDAFVKQINASRLAGNPDAENFDEAVSALGKHLWRPLASNGVGGGGVPDEVQAMFKDDACTNVTASSTNFWILVRALREFVAASPTQSLPLSGSIPDMKATSSGYIKLQNTYRTKSLQDLAQFKELVGQTCKSAGVEGNIADDEIEAFVKHAAYLKLIRGRSQRQRYEAPNQEVAMFAFMDPVNPSTFQHHIALAAADQFLEQHGRYAGVSHPSSASTTSSISPKSYFTNGIDLEASSDGERAAKRQKSVTPTGDAEFSVKDVKMHDVTAGQDTSKDESVLLDIAKKLATSKYGIEEEGDEWDKIEHSVQELVRSGDASLPPTTALMGGVVAQEAIKLITKQYVPADNTVVYDGIQQAIGVFKL
ncbi:Molybdenum cofactor biosynthesis, MoeB [Kalmanozyma brasiliensis GHG001]|uniref:NEDD8-activating enzyme E1 regulatory subunit n=1 Tax=Kalmanozyma brasiliensis (strain GHG001) TaxID=1365824 RepID=V5E635_KALBG|nr:Molybdenum cofactor biosynthesis, MoeB [Kalmanozyma brasiliensis GHG001]EST05696.1 Molybdenum cofactor biosynthesis, MoeB [Kalmanozyma brasiliensis GHG001]